MIILFYYIILSILPLIMLFADGASLTLALFFFEIATNFGSKFLEELSPAR